MTKYSEIKPLLSMAEKNSNFDDDRLTTMAEHFNSKLIELSYKNESAKYDAMRNYAHSKLPDAIKHKDSDAITTLLSVDGVSLDNPSVDIEGKKVSPLVAELKKEKPSTDNVKFVLQNGATAKPQHVNIVLNKNHDDKTTASLIEPLLFKGAKTNLRQINKAVMSNQDNAGKLLVDYFKPASNLPNTGKMVSNAISKDMLKTTEAMMKKKLFDADGYLYLDKTHETWLGGKWTETESIKPAEFAKSNEMKNLLQGRWQQKILSQRQRENDIKVVA